jgi:carbon monoxide dehydrogenase subunit G
MIEVAITINASPQRVWAEIADIARHVEWMADAESIEFTSSQTEGVDTQFLCVTKIGPFRLRDVMTVTQWSPGRAIGIRHDGLVRGTGTFTLAAEGPDASRFAWSERLVFPWWMGGRVGAFASKPVLRAIWKRNLQRLKANCEHDVSSPS